MTREATRLQISRQMCEKRERPNPFPSVVLWFQPPLIQKCLLIVASTTHYSGGGIKFGRMLRVALLLKSSEGKHNLI